MNVGIIGQCKGGNAVLWFELFNDHLKDYKDIKKLTYLCRNENELDAKFKLVELYGKRLRCNCKYLSLIKTIFYSKIWTSFYLKVLLPQIFFDVIHIQGNYDPYFNLKIINNTKAKIVLQIMGSDFYQNYLNNKKSLKEQDKFVEVLRKVNHIVCSRESSKKDLLLEFPFLKNKISVIRLGTGKKWLKKTNEELLSLKENNKKKTFISTRGLYDYNNVDKLVEAFCITYQDKKEAVKLNIINGYGSHSHVIRRVKEIILKYNCEDIVELKINQWITEDQLMSLYEESDYNFCIGDTDQLSISITYGFLTLTKNILSPINTYYELIDSGYRSLHILEEVTVNNLIDFFKKLPESSKDNLIKDREKASKEHIATENFKKYITVYKKIVYGI